MGNQIRRNYREDMAYGCGFQFHIMWELGSEVSNGPRDVLPLTTTPLLGQSLVLCALSTLHRTDLPDLLVSGIICHFHIISSNTL